MRHIIRIQGFTLVELIVVITILSILGTIGFLSLQGYSEAARDSARLRDISSLQRSLDYYYLQANTYPENTGAVVSFSGSTLWTQGFFDEFVRSQANRISQVPLDPLTKEKYVYSVTDNGQEYQLAAALESGIVTTLTTQTYADFQTLYVKGNYNEVFLTTHIGNDVYILGVPSLIVQTQTDIDILDIISQNKLLRKNTLNFPSALKVPPTNSEIIPVFSPSNPNNIILHTQSGDRDTTPEEIRILGKNIYDLYKESDFNETQEVSRILALSTNSPNFEEEIQFLTQELIQNNAKTSQIAKLFPGTISGGVPGATGTGSVGTPIQKYSFPSQSIAHGDTQTRIMSDPYDIVNNLLGFTTNTDIPFTTGGDGNPTAVHYTTGQRASSGNLREYASIEIDVPAKGESYTGIVYIPGYELSFTVSRDAGPALGTLDLDFGTNNIGVSDAHRITSKTNQFPTITSPTAFTLSGEGNPTARRSDGSYGNSGTVGNSTEIVVDAPAQGETRIVQVTIAGQTGTFTVKRAAPPVSTLDLDFGTKNIGYYDAHRITSKTNQFPTITSPTPFTLSGTGNPTARSNSSGYVSSGTVGNSTEIVVDAPARGTTRVVQITINGQTGSFTVTRAANP